MRIALAGNPNSGKTTIYNALTGRCEKVGNWAGVTVKSREAPVRRRFSSAQKITAVDLPGAYSLSPFTGEERITRDYVKNAKPDAIINVVDAANLHRSLFLTTQLLELGIPVVVALNKTDVSEKRGTSIDARALSHLLGCPVVETVATSGRGLQTLIAASSAGKRRRTPFDGGYPVPANGRAEKEDDRRRFAFVRALVAQVERKTADGKEGHIRDDLDGVLTNPWVGIPVFGALMMLVFQISQTWVGRFFADRLTGALEGIRMGIGARITGASPLLSAVLVDGILGGAIAVIGFLPLVMVMYFLLALLEDCGYMARASAVLDPIFKRVGLSGRSVIPFVMATGCAVPGIMATRTIRSERERRTAAMLAPFMPCGAKIPMISLVSGAFFGNAGWVSACMYLLAALLILLGALLVKKITGGGEKTYCIIELPPYQIPSVSNALRCMCSRGLAYVAKASTVIVMCNTAVKVMQMFTWGLTVAPNPEESILASVAQPIARGLLPVVGTVSWPLAAAAITGLIARENVVATLSICLGVSGLTGSGGADLAARLGVTHAAALAYLVLILFAPPCAAAIGAMRAEMKSSRWLWGGLALQLGLGYSAAVLVYQAGTLAGGGRPGAGFLPGLAAVAVIAAAVGAFCIRGERKAMTEVCV